MKTLVTAAVMAAAAAALAQETVDPRKQDIVNRLSAQKVTVDFREIGLREAVDFLRDATGINFHVDGKCEDKGEIKISLKVKDLPLKTVIKLMLAPHELTAVYSDGVLVLKPVSDARGTMVTQVYDVRDLLMKIGDFPGPKVELTSAASGPVTGIITTIEPEPATPINEDLITELIRGNTGGSTWDDPAASITLANGMLVVVQTKGTHREIDGMLNKLRQYR
jgi:hypothetical protein